MAMLSGPEAHLDGQMDSSSRKAVELQGHFLTILVFILDRFLAGSKQFLTTKDENMSERHNVDNMEFYKVVKSRISLADRATRRRMSSVRLSA
jgi:hypothetical protein